MDQPAEETAAAAAAAAAAELEDLCDDLHALKKLYGLLQRENTNEFQFQLDETSRNFLKKVLDGATLRILNQAKIVSSCDARHQDHTMSLASIGQSPAAVSLITTPAEADQKQRTEKNRRPTHDLKRLNSRGSSTSLLPRQQKKTKLQNTTTTPTPVELDVVRNMDRSSKHSNASLLLGKSTAKRSSRHGIAAGISPSTQGTAEVEADAKVEQVRRREQPPCLYKKSERPASEVRRKQPVHDQEMIRVRPNHHLLHDHQSLLRPSIHPAGKHEMKKQSGDQRRKALPSSSRQKARSQSTVEHSLSSTTESCSSSNTSRQSRAMPSNHGGKPPLRQLRRRSRSRSRRRLAEPPINKTNQQMEKEGRLERLKNRLSVIFHHHHHHHHLHHHHTARNGDGVVRRRHRSLWEYLRSVGHRSTSRETEGLGRRPPEKHHRHLHALLEALIHLFVFSTKKEVRKRAPPLGTAKKKFRWWQRLGRRVRLISTRRHRKNARRRLGIGMTK